MKKILLSLIALLILMAVPASAQTYLRTTTLSANITATQTQFAIASGTGVEAGGALYVDHELIHIVSCAVAACTTVNVNRIQKPLAHASAAQVFVVSLALKAQALLTHDGARRSGQCSTVANSTRATALVGLSVLPLIDVDTGDIYDCRRNGVSGAWVWNVINVQQYNGEAGSTWAQ